MFCLPIGKYSNEQIKVTGIHLPKQFKILGENDYALYDYAIIVIEENNKITPDIPLQIEWNHKFGTYKNKKNEIVDEQILISGYPDYDPSRQYYD